MATQTKKKFSISFRQPVKRTFLETARKNIIKRGKAQSTLSRDIDKIVYGI